jgi:hypothetical protein
MEYIFYLVYKLRYRYSQLVRRHLELLISGFKAEP